MSAINSTLNTLRKISKEFGFPDESDQKLRLISGFSMTDNIFRTVGAAVFARYINHHYSRPKEFIFELMMREIAQIIRAVRDDNSFSILALYDIRINGQPRDLLDRVEAYKESQHARNQNLPQE